MSQHNPQLDDFHQQLERAMEEISVDNIPESKREAVQDLLNSVCTLQIAMTEEGTKLYLHGNPAYVLLMVLEAFEDGGMVGRLLRDASLMVQKRFFDFLNKQGSDEDNGD